MLQILKKHQSIYLFFIVLSLVGFISGFQYYSIQSDSLKSDIYEEYNLKDNLSVSNSNLWKSFRLVLTILLCGIFVLPQIFNLFGSFYYPFQLGFLFSFLHSIHYKLALRYFCFYHLFPFLCFILLLRISFSISKEVIGFFLYRKRKYFIRIQLLCYKYLFISFFYLLYQFVISIFSLSINNSLIPFL